VLQYLSLFYQYIDNDGNKHWKCLWCHRTFQHWNAAKALFHGVKKETGGEVRKCTSHAIDAAHKQEYNRLLQKYKQQKNAQKTLVESKRLTSDEYLVTARDAYTSTRKKKVTPGTVINVPSPTELSVTKRTQSLLNFAHGTPLTGQSNPSPSFHQQKLGDVVDPQAEDTLTMAIADLIHACGLPFSLASHHKFLRVLSLSKLVSKKFVPPGRNKIAGELLDLNYQLYKQKNLELLQKEANIFGISFFGDGATVKKSPLINILASSVHLPVGCLRIVDCSGHLETDGRKDATYISNLFLPHITEMEEKIPKCTDLVIFDCASNVQKAGQLIEARFPHISVIHGAEHVISLFYHDIFHLREFEILKKLNRHIYRYFGTPETIIMVNLLD